MRSAVFALTIAALSLVSLSNAHADGTCTPAAPSTWGHSTSSPTTDAQQQQQQQPRPDESPVTRARDLLSRARLLDEVATADDKAATEIAARLPTLRSTAKVAREKADRASGEDRETLVARAEDLEADVAISEAETSTKRREAVDNRRVARELRARAVRTVREAPVEATPTTTNACDPPYRFTPDGRKIYRIECLK